MLIGLHIWEGLYTGSVLTGFYSISSETSNSHNIWDTASLEVFSKFWKSFDFTMFLIVPKGKKWAKVAYYTSPGMYT